MSDSIKKSIKELNANLPKDVQLVAVSKTKPIEDITTAYQAGQRHFGENKIQELEVKAPALSNDIVWHFIGHLQSKKAKEVIKYADLIHSVDSLKLATEINKRSAAIGKIQDILLQFHIAEEDSKFGFKIIDIESIISELQSLKNIRITGVMGMATFTDDENQVKIEFNNLKTIFNELKSNSFQKKESFQHISMGMTGDYKLAIECGSNMVRIGSLIFGSRN